MKRNSLFMVSSLLSIYVLLMVLGLFTCTGDIEDDHTVITSTATSAIPTITETAAITATATRTPTIPGDPSAGDLYSVDAIVGNMRYVPAGIFTQGSWIGEQCRDSDETPFDHELTYSRVVMETEVTRQMWADLKSVQPSLPVDRTNTQYAPVMSNPVNKPTWYEAVLFANLLSKQNGLTCCYYSDSTFTIPIDATNYDNNHIFCHFKASGYRLLCEGEWEYAARAGTTGYFSCEESNYTSGNCESCTPGTQSIFEQYAVFCANSNGMSEPVGIKLANPWNLKDMHGNVWEWCWDSSGTYPPSATTDYTGPDNDSYFRVVRGGSWNYSPRYCRSAERLSHNGRSAVLGFRLARTVN